MKPWEKLFDNVALARARAIDSDRVTITDRSETRVDAAILGAERTEVRITLKNDMPVIMRCKCPKARSGRNCEHMAAVLYKMGQKDISEIQQIWDDAVPGSGGSGQTEETEKQEKKAEAEKRIAEKKAQKAAQKSERKRKRAAAEEAQRKAREEETRRKREELKRQQEEAARKAAEEEQKRREEEARRKQQEEEAIRKKEEKVRAAIARKNEPEEAGMLVPVEPKVKYQYFDMDTIIKSLNIPNQEMQKGRELLASGKIDIESVETGYFEYMDELVVMVSAYAENRKKRFPVKISFTRDEMIRTDCGCPDCYRYMWYASKKSSCSFVAAVCLYTKAYLMQQEVGDATDKYGAHLLSVFQKHHTNQVVSTASMQEETMALEPRLARKDGELRLSFKVGTNKLYVVKDMIEFCRQVRGAETVQFGTNTKLSLNISNFTPRARQWYDFMGKVIQEEEDFINRINEIRYYYYDNKRKCPDFGLYGWRLDQFCEIMDEDAVEYEDKMSGKKGKAQLTCREGTPKLTMQICKSNIGKKKEFHGIDVSCRMPEFYAGTDYAYYIKDSVLYKTDIGIMDKIRPLLNMSDGGELKFQIGRNKLTDFYYSMLPQLEDTFTVMEEDSEEIHQYLPPEVEFIFYLDAENSDITCRVAARYGQKEYSVIDSVAEDSWDLYYASHRLEGREREIFFLTRQLFPYADNERDLFYCGGEEDVIYEVLSRGVETLAELGEVKCTNAFRNLNIVKKIRMTVGVSVSSGLLDMDIDTEDISRAELLEVLKGYKLRKKYYRLKNGDFINLEDENLRMLKELMDTLHLPPKEFIKGKVHLPIYRTLYLDKLLEEKEGLYTNRDHTFREMVKNFKTISDADYEVPASLKRVMRGYQKNGYKWIKTLQSCQFGGILADDMGLGKTIQAISFLLSEKESRKKEGTTTLIVAPASLVFNWGEEFEKFGPALKVQLITGDQQERQKKIEDYKSYDVSVTSYDLLRRDISYYEGKKFTYEIIDEAQYIKNHTTAAAKAVKVIDSGMRMALTGTPIENRLSELWSIFDFLMPGFLYSYEVFKRDVETPIVKYDDKEVMKRLQRMVGPFIMRRLKSDVLKDLPDKLEEVRYVKFEKAQQTAYDAQVVHMQEMLAKQDDEDFNKNKLKVLAELTRLRQICCDPGLCFDNYTGESAKLDSCIELVQSAMDGGHKMLVFSQFTSMLELIRAKLDGQGIGYYMITGETSKEKRLQLVKAFNEDEVPVFLISLKAGGVGLNLTGADVVIHYDPWWNIAAQNQATDRAHRIGQTKKVTVYKLIVRHTIEEKILKLQETKRDLAEQVMNGDLGQLGSMSKDELLDLLQG